jgi:hypothetical protein
MATNRPPHREQVRGRIAGQIGHRIEVEIIAPHHRKGDHRQPNAPAGIRRRLAVKIVHQHQRPGSDGEAKDVRRRAQCLVDDVLGAEARQYAGNDDLKPDHRRDSRVDDPHRPVPLVVGGALHDPVHEGEEGEVAGALRKPGREVPGPEQGNENGPGRHHREGGDERPVAAVAVPVPELPDCQRPEQHGCERVAPEADESDHRAPSGHSTTRTVWRRINMSRKGV